MRTLLGMALVVLLVAPGCGGGGGGAGLGGPNGPDPNGPLITNASVDLTWPARSRDVIQHPITSANSIVVTAKGAAADGSDVALSHDRDPSKPGGFTETYTFPVGLKQGNYALTISLYSQTGGNGILVGAGTANAVVASNGLTIANLVINGTVKSLSVVATTLKVTDPQYQLQFVATDKDGKTVVVALGAALWSISDGTTNIALTQDGLCTARSKGLTNVVANVDGVASAPTGITVINPSGKVGVTVK